MAIYEMNTGILPVLNVGSYWGGMGMVYDCIAESIYDDVELESIYPTDEDKDKAVAEDYESAENTMLSLVPEYMDDIFSDAGIPAKVVGEAGIQKPKYYNYGDDIVYYDTEISDSWIDQQAEELSRSGEFADYLKYNYGSHSGYISFSADNVNDFIKDIHSDGRKRQLAVAQIIMYIIDNNMSMTELERYSNNLIDDVLGDY